MKKPLFFNSFILKLVALIAMTIDHVGVLTATTFNDPLRIIGRIAFPLFIFMSVEGAQKTTNLKKYLLRLGIIAISVSISLIYIAYFMSYGKSIAYGSGNIFIDLLIVVIVVRILMSKNRKIKPIIIIPFLYAILCYVVMKIEGCGCVGYFEWLPAPIRMQYSIYSMLLCFGFYYSKPIAEKTLKSFEKTNNLPEKTYTNEASIRWATNIVSVMVLIVATIIFVTVNVLYGEKYTVYGGYVGLYAILAGAFILFYNGRRGYNAKWFKYACYLYYPAHILVLAAIFLM